MEGSAVDALLKDLQKVSAELSKSRAAMEAALQQSTPPATAAGDSALSMSEDPRPMLAPQSSCLINRLAYGRKHDAIIARTLCWSQQPSCDSRHWLAWRCCLLMINIPGASWSWH